MDSDLEKGSAVIEKPTQIETPDGKSIFVFRYDNPMAPNRNPNSAVSQDQLVGKWFTDSLNSLETYILMRPAGGNILVTQIPKDKIETIRAQDHPEAQKMDIEPLDNYIIPDEFLIHTQRIPLDVAPSGTEKYLLKDKPKIDEFVKDAISKLQVQTT